jgi:hypothetical protein
MGLFATIWSRPGSATPGRVIDEPPTNTFSFHDGVGLAGDGTLTIPESFPFFDDILLIDPATPANSASSTVRVFDDATSPPTWVFDWLPKSMLPVTAKQDFDVNVAGRGIKSILEYARTEAWDWDGSANFVPKFPDWIYGGRNILTNPSFEDQSFVPRIYWLLIDATAGTFTLSDGTDTTSALAFDIGDGQLEGEIESDIAAIDDLSVTPLEGVPRGYQILITATAGTFTIALGASVTGNLAFNIGAGALETAIEGLTGITNVTVTAITVDGVGGFQVNLHTPASADLAINTTNLSDGSAQMTVSRSVDGFALEFVSPPTGITLTVNDSGLTGSARLQLVEPGEVLPTGWMKSQQISAGTPREYGTYDTFEPSQDQAHTGSWSLKIDPANITSYLDRYAGCQQIPTVTPGGLYQASVWVFPTAPGQQYRLVIRGIDEDLISTPLFAGNISPPANVWTKVTVSNVTIPAGDTRVIFRFANINNSGNPAIFYVDDAAFEEGQAAATVGKILGDLYDDATADHPGRIVWEDEANPGTPYLTLDFDDDVDSNGAAWADPEIKVKIWMRMHYGQVMDTFALSWDYEWRIVPDNLENQTYLWQVYNPGTMKTDYTAAPGPAIQGGSQDTRRSLQRFVPEGTDVMVEGLERITSRAQNAGLVSSLGYIETSRIDRELPEDASDAAATDAANLVTHGVQYQYTLTDPVETYGVDYLLGDLLTIHDPPLVDAPGRLADVEVTVSPFATHYEVTFIPEEI